MDLSFSDDQRLLEDSVARFVRNEYEFDKRRTLADVRRWVSAAIIGRPSRSSACLPCPFRRGRRWAWGAARSRP